MSSRTVEVNVQINNTPATSYNSSSWNTVRAYQFSYEQSGPTTIVDPTRTSTLNATSHLVLRPAPFHSFKAIPHSVLKMMMLAMCSVQLENLNRPICDSPIV